MDILFFILHVVLMLQDSTGSRIAMEVAIMEKLSARTSGSAGTSAPVSLLDWYDLDQELILVMERPVPCKDLFDYIRDKGGSLQEEETKVSCWPITECV